MNNNKELAKGYVEKAMRGSMVQHCLNNSNTSIAMSNIEILNQLEKTNELLTRLINILEKK